MCVLFWCINPRYTCLEPVLPFYVCWGDGHLMRREMNILYESNKKEMFLDREYKHSPSSLGLDQTFTVVTEMNPKNIIKRM